MIYVIDDNEAFGRYACVLLEAGAETEAKWYSSPIEGLQACLASPPQLVLLDLEMPNLRGEEVLRLLRSAPHTKTLPVIICSSMPEPLKRELELLQLGADRYLPKPPEDVVLVSAAREFLDLDSLSALEDHPADGTILADESRADANPAFENYEILEMIGGGAAGTVYRAREIGSGREVALKVLLRVVRESNIMLERFLREAEIMRTLDHPNVVRVQGAGNTDHSYYIAMELVEGKSLDKRLNIGNVSFAAAREIIRQLLDGVEYLHSQGVIHRDIKPHNIFCTFDGLIKIGDFGISHSKRFESELNLTQTGAIVGTPRYMAPEQLLGAEANELTDQYSVGRTILHLFEGPTPAVPPPALHDIRPDLPRRLSEAIARCMDTHPSRRFPDIAAARDDIMAACEETIGQA